LEPFDLVLTVEILRVTWHDVWPGNEPGFGLVKILDRTIQPSEAQTAGPVQQIADMAQGAAEG
jgi:hypothetical protein